jgi:WD40 repeat protein
LKPTNIMVGRFGEVYVMDWGLAKVLGQKDLHDLRLAMSSGVTQTSIRSDRESTAASTPESPLITMDGSVVGTPAYMSPEQALGKVDEVEAPADVYSMGAILYNLLTGQAPYVVPGARISPHTILGMVIQGPPRPVATLDPKAPAELVAICERAMARDKARRYRNCSELAEDLQAFLDHRVVQAYRTGAVAELRSWVSRNRLTATVGVASMVLALIGVAAWSLWQRETALRAKEQLARAYLRQGQTMCQAGEVHLGVHWMVRALRECPPRQQVLAAVIQRNVLDWSQRSTRLLYVLEHATVDPWERFSSADTAPRFAIRPDGRQLASGGAGALTVRVWSLETGEPVGKGLVHPAVVSSLFYAEGGRTLATVAADSRVRRWNLEGTLLGDPIQLGSGVQVLATRPARDLLAAGLGDGSIQVLSVKEEPTSKVIQAGTSAVTALALAEDGGELVAGFADGTALILPIGGGESSRLHVPSGEAIINAVFSPDGRFLAIARADGEVRLCSAETGDPVGNVMPHPVAANLLKFSPDSRALAVAGQPEGDATVRLWHVPDATPLGEPLLHQSWVPALDFSPDGRLLATGGNDFYARLWSLPGGHSSGSGIPHAGFVGQLAFTPDGSRLVVSSMGELEVWSIPADRAADHTLVTKSPELWATDFNRDGSQLLLAGHRGPPQIWSTKTFDLMSEFPYGDWNWNALFSRDGRAFLTVGDGFAQLWTTQGHLTRGFTITNEMLRYCAWHPDGRRIAIGSFGKRARVYEAETGTLLSVLEHPDIVEDLKFHPDGSTLLTGCGDGNARLWSLTGTNLVVPLMKHDNAILAVAFSPDGKRIATGSRDLTVRFWEAATGRPTDQILRHQAWVEDLAFSRDGQWLVSGCADGTVHVWSVATAEEVGPPLRHLGAVRTVAIHPGGEWIVAGGDNPRATVWRVPWMSGAVRADPELWVEIITGSKLTKSGTLNRLPTAEWQRLKKTVPDLGTR